MKNIESATMVHEVQELVEKIGELANKYDREIRVLAPANSPDHYLRFDIGAYDDGYKEKLMAWRLKDSDNNVNWNYANRGAEFVAPSHIDLLKKVSK